MDEQKPRLSWKDRIAIPFVIVLFLFTTLIEYLSRKLQGRSMSDAKLVVSEEEMQLLVRASNDHIPVIVNGQERLLAPFTNPEQHVPPERDCGCPDDLFISDVKKRGCLSGTREQGESSWKICAMRPVLWGVLGEHSDDLKTLQIGERSIGTADIAKKSP